MGYMSNLKKDEDEVRNQGGGQELKREKDKEKDRGGGNKNKEKVHRPRK